MKRIFDNSRQKTFFIIALTFASLLFIWGSLDELSSNNTVLDNLPASFIISLILLGIIFAILFVLNEAIMGIINFFRKQH